MRDLGLTAQQLPDLAVDTLFESLDNDGSGEMSMRELTAALHKWKVPRAKAAGKEPTLKGVLDKNFEPEQHGSRLLFIVEQCARALPLPPRSLSRSPLSPLPPLPPSSCAVSLAAPPSPFSLPLSFFLTRRHLLCWPCGCAPARRYEEMRVSQEERLASEATKRKEKAAAAADENLRTQKAEDEERERERADRRQERQQLEARLEKEKHAIERQLEVCGPSADAAA